MKDKTPYLIIALVVIVLIVIVVFKPIDKHTEAREYRDSLEVANNIKIKELEDRIIVLTAKSDSIQSEYDKKKVEIRYKYIKNEKKYINIISLDADSSIGLFHANYSR